MNNIDRAAEMLADWVLPSVPPEVVARALTDATPPLLMPDPQIIRTVEELEALDPDVVLMGAPWHGIFTTHTIAAHDLPAVVVASAAQVRAARKALEGSMNITPDQARELLDGATPGPWRSEYDNEIIETDTSTVLYNTDGAVEWGHNIEHDVPLTAAAPDLAQTVIAQGAQIQRLRNALRKADKWGDCLGMLIDDGFIEPEDMEEAG